MLCLDNYGEIASWIDDGYTWKSWIFTCKAFFSMNSRERIVRFSDTVPTLVRLFPEKWYGLERLARIGKLPFEVFLKMEKRFHPHALDMYCVKFNNPQLIIDAYSTGTYSTDPLRLENLSSNRFITMEIVKSNPWIVWDRKQLSANRMITMEIVNAHSDYPFDFEALSMNPSITLEQMLDNPHLPWAETFYLNPTLTLERFDNSLEKLRKRFPSLVMMSARSSLERLSREEQVVKIEYIRDNLHLRWNWFNLSMKQFTWKEIESIPSEYWKLHLIAKHNSHITPELMLSPLFNGVYMSWYSQNPVVTIEILKQHPDLEWDMDHISECIPLTMKEVKENPQIPWSIYGLSKNPSISWLDIVENPEMEWDFSSIFSRG